APRWRAAPASAGTRGPSGGWRRRPRRQRCRRRAGSSSDAIVGVPREPPLTLLRCTKNRMQWPPEPLYFVHVAVQHRTLEKPPRPPPPPHPTNTSGKKKHEPNQ